MFVPERLPCQARISLFRRTRETVAAILFWMSRAFIREDVDPPERSGRKRSASGLPPGAVNYITARGAARLQAELAALCAAGDKSKRITELKQILGSVKIVEPPEDPSKSVSFGATVT